MGTSMKQPRSSHGTEQFDVPTTKKDLDGKFGKGTAWRCETCECVLGVVSPDHVWVCIKFKDDYTYVQGGNVIRICRRCGSWNSLTDEGPPTQLPV